MNQSSDILLQQVFDGVEISDEELGQLQGMLVISQTKTAVELLLGLSSNHTELLTSIATLLKKYHEDLSVDQQQQYETAMTRQAANSIAEIVKIIQPHLQASEVEIVQKNLAVILSEK